MRIVVFHDGYGCETGCTGHSIAIDPDISEPRWHWNRDKFFFRHPHDESPEDMKQWAARLVAKEYGEDHVKDIDWDHCYISDDEGHRYVGKLDCYYDVYGPGQEAWYKEQETINS